MPPLPPVPLLRLSAVSKLFRAGAAPCAAHVRALHDVDIEVSAGEILHLFGGPGCGKSTLLMCAAGLMKPDAGAVSWSGDHPECRRRAGIVYFPTSAYTDEIFLHECPRALDSAWLALIDAPPPDGAFAHDYIAAAAATRAAAAGAAVILASRTAESRWIRADRIATLAHGRIVRSS